MLTGEVMDSGACLLATDRTCVGLALWRKKMVLLSLFHSVLRLACHLFLVYIILSIRHTTHTHFVPVLDQPPLEVEVQVLSV